MRIGPTAPPCHPIPDPTTQQPVSWEHSHLSIMMYNRLPCGSFLLQEAGVDIVLRTYIKDPCSESECVVACPHGEVMRILTVSLWHCCRVMSPSFLISGFSFLRFFFYESRANRPNRIRFLILIHQSKACAQAISDTNFVKIQTLILGNG